MKKIVVTGAEGFIGSHLVETLLDKGFEVKALVLYNFMGSWGWLEQIPQAKRKGLEVVLNDIRDPKGMNDLVKGADAVLNLAALIGIPYSYQAPDLYVDVNIKGTLNLLNAAREFGVQRFIQTSTSEVYGTARFVPITELHPLQPQSPYSATKIAADALAYSYFASFGLPVTILRPFNTYGPRQSTRAVIPTIIAQIANGERTIKLGSLTPTRDFNFVKDTANGFLSALQAPAMGEAINIGSNFEISIGDTVQMIAELMGTKIEIQEQSDRVRPANSEVERLWADNSKADQLLGWKPQYAGREGLKRGLKETIEWFLKPENLRHYKSDLYNV